MGGLVGVGGLVYTFYTLLELARANSRREVAANIGRGGRAREHYTGIHRDKGHGVISGSVGGRDVRR